jgi:hypothetical protein
MVWRADEPQKHSQIGNVNAFSSVASAKPFTPSRKWEKQFKKGLKIT